MNNYPSDEEVRIIYSDVVHGNNFQWKDLDKLVDNKDRGYKTHRDFLFYKLLDGWNAERVRSGFKPLSKARLASAINNNPLLKVKKNDSQDDTELIHIIKECERVGNYKYAHFVLFGSKKKDEKRA